MRTFKAIFGIVALSFMLLTVSCKEEQKTADTNQTEQEFRKEYDSAYICPMHCEDSGSDKEGECPKCGMAYVKNEDHKGDGHSH